jgi:cyclopropane-fatty-acyl-phospholipid synthase
VIKVLLVKIMRRCFRFGRLTFVDAAGNRHQICSLDGPRVVLRVLDEATQRKLLLASSLAWGEAYMDGGLVLESGSLADLIEIFMRSGRGKSRRVFSGLQTLGRHFNSIPRSHCNVALHYDLSSDLYNCFLDADRQYSCAYFQNGDEDLDTAQLKKKRHIAAKLDIRPGMRVLDIGSGWGGLALYLAQHFDCRVTGITLSKEQYRLSQRRARALGIEDRVDFALRDYRVLDGEFDRIVSVGMLEHVGPLHYRGFFRRLRELMRPGGAALIHSIVRMHGPGRADPWLHRYIFPGGYLPAISQLTRAIERNRLWLTDLENLRFHYAETLRHWYRRYEANRSTVEALYDERFCRMWELYLLGCEAVFRYRPVSVLQLQIAREASSLPLTRDYQYRAERQLAANDSRGSCPPEASDKTGLRRPETAS